MEDLMKQFKDQMGSEETMRKFTEQLDKINEDLAKSKDKFDTAKEEAIKEGKDPESVKADEYFPKYENSEQINQLNELKETMKNLSSKVREDPKIKEKINVFVDKYVFEDKKEDAKEDLMKMLSGEDSLKNLDGLDNQQCTIC